METMAKQISRSRSACAGKEPSSQTGSVTGHTHPHSRDVKEFAVEEDGVQTHNQALDSGYSPPRYLLRKDKLGFVWPFCLSFGV